MPRFLLVTLEPHTFPKRLIDRVEVVNFLPTEVGGEDVVLADSLHPLARSRDLENLKKKGIKIYRISRLPPSSSQRRKYLEIGEELVYIEDSPTVIEGGLEITVPDEPLPRKGRLKELAWPLLLGMLHRARARGRLYLKSGPVKKLVYFMDGMPVQIKSNKGRELLGKMLVEEGKITEEDLETSLKLMKTKGILQGQALVQMGLITQQELTQMLKRQWEIKLLDVFTWKEGDFLFKPDPTLTGENWIVGSTLVEVILNGLKLVPPAAVKKVVSEAREYYLLPHPDPITRFQPLPHYVDWTVFSSIDGKMSVGEFLERNPDYVLELVTLLYTRVLALSRFPSTFSTRLRGFPITEETLSPEELLTRIKSMLQSLLQPSNSDTRSLWMRRIHGDHLVTTSPAVRERLQEAFMRLAALERMRGVGMVEVVEFPVSGPNFT